MWAVAHAVRLKVGVGVETLRNWALRGQAAGPRSSATREEIPEIKRVKKENAELRETNEILKSAAIFFAREPDPRHRYSPTRRWLEFRDGSRARRGRTRCRSAAGLNLSNDDSG